MGENEAGTHKILLVSETQGYLVTSLKNKLEAANYEVIVSRVEIDSLCRTLKEAEAVFLFAEEELEELQQGVVYLKDTVLENEVPLFVTGGVRELDEVHKNIPASMIKKEFPRPLNVNEVCTEIDGYMKTEAKHNKKIVLVVDDSGAVLRNVKGWLEDKYQVVLANSGTMAIKYLSTNRPDLVLLDYEMPILDGRQVLQMIRSEMEFADIPVIFLTSKGDRESVMQVMMLKPDGYLLKTLPPEKIRQSVDNFFERQKISGK